MKKFVNRIIVFFLGTLFLIFLTILITSNCINQNRNFHLPDKIKMLILGHSHPEGAFNDSLIEGAKNMAQSGELYFYTYLKVKKIVSANKQVKCIFLEFTNNQITMDMEKWTKSEEQILYRVPKYAPVMMAKDYFYIGKNNPLALIKSIPLVIKNNMHAVIFNDKEFMISNDWGKYYYNKRQHVDSLLQVKNEGKFKTQDLSESTDVNVKNLLRIISFCKQRKVAVYLIRSPYHKEYPGILNENMFQEILKTELYQVPFLDFRKFPLANNEYGDFDHLNYKGAEKFSLFFNQLLKEGLLEKDKKQDFINQKMKNISNK